MDSRRKRLKFRAWRRGFRELDLIIGAFADAHLETLTDAELDAFENLLDAPDQEVYAWIIGTEPPAPAHDGALLARIAAFQYALAAKAAAANA